MSFNFGYIFEQFFPFIGDLFGTLGAIASSRFADFAMWAISSGFSPFYDFLQELIPSNFSTYDLTYTNFFTGVTSVVPGGSLFNMSDFYSWVIAFFSISTSLFYGFGLSIMNGVLSLFPNYDISIFLQMPTIFVFILCSTAFSVILGLVFGLFKLVIRLVSVNT